MQVRTVVSGEAELIALAKPFGPSTTVNGLRRTRALLCGKPHYGWCFVVLCSQYMALPNCANDLNYD